MHRGVFLKGVDLVKRDTSEMGLLGFNRLSYLLEVLHQVGGDRENDGRRFFAGDVVQRREIAELHGVGLFS